MMSLLPKLLITGASGFTGQHACRYFSEKRYAVTAVVNENKHISFNNDLQIEHCNLTDREAVRSLIHKVKPQYLLHLAGKNHVGQSWMDPVASLEANVLSTLYLIEALRHEKTIRQMVVVGSILQFKLDDLSSLTNPYSLSKTLQVLIAQSWEKLYNLPIIISQPSNLIGPGVSKGVCSIFAKKIVEMEADKIEKLLEVDNLYAQRDFIDVRDVIKAYELLLLSGKSGEIYEITSGKSYSLEEVVNVFRCLTKVDFQIKTQVCDQIEKKIAVKPLKILKLGWKPNISIHSSLEDTLNFYRLHAKKY